MGKYIVCFSLQRILLPISLIASVVIRPIGISVIYLLLFFYLPLVPVATPASFKGHTGHYLRAVLFICTLLLSVQLAWHITLASIPLDWFHDWTQNCELIETILRHTGFVQFYELNYLYVLKWISPEILMTTASLAIYICCSKLCKEPPDVVQEGNSPKKKGTFLVNMGKYMSLLLLMFTGCLRPSILSGLYYLTFLGSSTWWACGKELNRGYAVVCKIIMLILCCHILMLFAYQTVWILELLPPANLYSRYFGLTQLITMNCTSDPREFEYLDLEWASYVSPVMLAVLYYVLAFESRELLKPQPEKKSGTFSKLESGSLNGSLRRTMSMKLSRGRMNRSTLTQDKWRSATRKVRILPFLDDRRHATESTPLIRAVSPNRKYLSRKSNASGSIYYQDSTGSVTVGPEEGIPMKALKNGEEDLEKPSILEHVVYSIANIFQMLIRTSYIATAIIMIVWSITYHSWLTFILLLWANVIWMVHDQRGFTLRSSPFLVTYAQLLLLAQYLYGMDINEDEIPFQIKGMNMAQIGFERRLYLPCIPLIVKSVYTIMFWVTLRQLMQEIREKKQSSALADMVAPLQVTVGAATAVLEEERPMKTSPILKNLGDFLRQLLTKYFICLVAIMLLVIGITGQRMTVFRIIYMALFLIFVLTFQISRKAWRKMMYGFLVTVIVYSMSILVLIYTYQFDNFPAYWDKYLHISHTLQLDIGLELYETKELFLRLLTPTLFLIMTVVQLHYFHKDLLAITHVKSRSSSVGRQDSQGPFSIASSMMGGSSLPPPTPMEKNAPDNMDFVGETIEEKHKSGSYTHLSSKMDFATWISGLKDIVCEKFAKFCDFVYLFLELHLIKIIMLSVMLLCVFDVCAIHFAFVLMICIGSLFNTKLQLVLIHFITTITCILLLCKMIYQIEYIEHSSYSVNCTYSANPASPENSTVVTFNNAEWFGFKKTGEMLSLPSLVKGYIALILLSTFRAMVEFRQTISRFQKNDPTVRPYLMFPRITRLDADKDIIHFLQYICNYGFYKFGVEVCLMCLVGVIGSRLDVWAVLYSGWLCILWCSSREKLSRIWKWFVGYIVVVLPFQYLLVVGVIPELCVEYPWMNYDEILQRTRNWMMLPDPTHPPFAAKLICDFILLILCSRQSLVFRIERRHGQNYKGGFNSDVILEDWESPDFQNHIPDFVTYFRSWLDVIKRMAMMGSLWATLAIMFLTGTNRVNLFSMGYLVGSFIFLWHGTDLYLRPIKYILKWWNFLLGYNVAVIVIKACLQILGCIFIQYMQDHACWMVQLFGIGCIDKFSGKSFKTFLKMKVPVEEHECSVPREDIGLAWDGVCFGFLLMQRRLFQSHYFLRIINEVKAITILQSRGAELIEELRGKQMSTQDEQEKKILEKIKIKMDRIKANQQKFSGPMFKETNNHFVEDNSELKSSLKRSGSNVSECCISVRTPLGGYHTPRTPTTPGSPRGYHTPISQEGSPQHVRSPLGPPSPFSALNTVSLDAYLEPRRISFGSPPSSELNPQVHSPSESYPVFSPPAIRRPSQVPLPQHPQQFHTPRHSVISFSGRSQLSHHQSIRSGDYYMFDDFDDEELDLISEKESDEEEDKRPALGEFLSTAMKSDMNRARLLRRESIPRQAVRSRLSTHSLRRSHRALSTTVTMDQEHLLERDGEQEEEEDPDQDKSGSDVPLESPVESDTEVMAKMSLWNLICKYVLFVWAFIESLIVSLTKWMNKFSRDYRYVARTLTKEKILLKERPDFGKGLRDGPTGIWEPLPSTLMRLKKPRSSESSIHSEIHPVEASASSYQAAAKRRKESEMSIPEIRIMAPSLERGLDLDSPIHYSSLHRSLIRQSSVYSIPSSSDSTTPIEDYDDETFASDQPNILRFLFAIWYAILAHTDIVCYFMIFINQIQSAAILSLPLPLMVFLWGTLTIPRPSKTFWVTIIAYTEIIVLIKSMFQYEVLWWNQTVIPSNMPFSAPRIIGIERKSNYALYDLILLLIVFFHRYMLISLGLWKSETTSDEKEDRLYPLSPKQLSFIKEGKGFHIGQLFARKHAEESPGKKDGFKIESDKQELIEGQVATATSSKKSDDEDNSKEKSSPKGSSASEKEASTVEKVDSSDSVAEKGSQELVPYNEESYGVQVTSISDEPYKTVPDILKMSVKRYGESVKKFYGRMLDPTSRVKADVYAYMFMCDFFNFMVVIFGFSAFGTQQGDGGVQAYLEENKVPIPFLVMLLLQFALIIIDRALFLRKFILGKLLFQICLIIGVHIWMFFILPAVTERSFNALLPPPMWYMVKCIYLLLSAYQIRCGYPTRILGNFLCKGYNYLNMFLFKGFMLVPFLFELRTLMDWIWTDTSMTLMDWLKMEDIFANVFQMKCSRHVESEYPQPRGEKKSPLIKYLVGGFLLACLIALIWFPLVLFAFGNSVGTSNPPYDVTVNIRLGPYLPIYTMSAQSNNIKIFNENQWNTITNVYKKDRTAQTFLSNYVYDDLTAVIFNGNSTNVWGISPPDITRLKNQIESDLTINVKFTYIISHKTNSKDNPPVIREEIDVSLPSTIKGERNPQRDILLEMLNGNSSQWVRFNKIFPKFVKVFNKGEAKVVHQLMNPVPDEDDALYRDLELRLMHEEPNNLLWWEVKEVIEDYNHVNYLRHIPFYSSSEKFVMYAFSDKLFSATLNIISGSGIIGLYTTFVLLASRFVKGLFTGICFKIMFEDLPNVDRVFQLCLDIYLVRESRELALEEDLFAKLVFLYRSPETMIKWSRPKEEELEEEEGQRRQD